jgi:membrane-associated phospholipid phosphatase
MNALIIFCGKYLIFFMAVVALVFWLKLPRDQKLKVAVFGVIASVVAYGLAKVGSLLFYDPRPLFADHVVALFAHSNDNGFPSDHTLMGAVLAVTVYQGSKKIGLALGGMALVVGAARVLAHVHRPVDILGGVLFAAAGGLAAYYATPWALERMKRARAKTNE